MPYTAMVAASPGLRSWLPDTDRALSEPALERGRLLARLADGRAKIIALIAPAGFGKSTLAAQFSATSTRAAICDCAWVEDRSGFLRAVLAALAKESPESSATLATTQPLIADPSRMATESLELTLECWTACAAPAVFTFENVERIEALPDVLAVLCRLLAARPSSRTIVICSRTRARLQLTRFAAPHEIVALGAVDLAFDHNEMRAVLARLELDDAELERASLLSRGWPIAVLMLARLFPESRFHGFLETLGQLYAGDRDVLQSYVVEEALGSLSLRERELLAACALLPSPDALELSIATEADSVDDVSQGLAATPFLRVLDGGRYELHPLVQEVLSAAQPKRRCALLRRVAGELVARGRFTRAAFLFLEARDQRSAANALARVDALTQQRFPVEYGSVVTRLDSETLAAYPALWYGSAFARRYNVDESTMVREAQGYWLGFGPEATPADRAPLLTALALLLSDLGRHAEARDAIESFQRESNLPERPQNFFHASLEHVHAAVLARMGHLAEAEKRFEAALPLIADRHVSSANCNANRAIYVERVLGRRDRERAMLDNAILHAKQSQTVTLFVGLIAESTFAAWLAGEDDLYAEHLQLLSDQVESHAIRGLRHFVACARGRARPQCVGIESLVWLVEAHLIASTKAPSPAAARDHANAAIAAADRYNVPMLQVLSRIAAVQIDPDRHETGTADALLLARRVDSLPLNRAVAAWSRGSQEMELLAPFLARFASRRSERVPLLKLLAGRVSTPDGTIVLRPREHELLLLLAARRRPVSIGELTASLWPDDDDERARNAFYVLVSRMRKRFGDSELIVHSPEGYAINARAAVDFWEAEDAYREVKGRDRLDDSTRGRLQVILEQLRARSVGQARGRDWYGAFERRVSGLIRNVGLLLARDALRRGGLADAIATAEALIAEDPLDEDSREIAIRAHLQSGSVAAARREYRSYDEVLMRELGTHASGALQDLLKTS